MVRSRSSLMRCVAVVLIFSITTTPLLFADRGRTVRQPGRFVDGELLFAGLYFGRGPGAEYFPEIWQNEQVLKLLKGVDLQAATVVQNQLMDLLRQEDATIFTRFGAEMQSGDPVRIREVLTDMGSRMRRIASKQFDIEERLALQEEDSQGQCIAWAVVVVAAVAVLAVVLTAVSVYLYVQLWGPDIESYEDVQTSGGTLGRDIFIDTLARRLDAREAR